MGAAGSVMPLRPPPPGYKHETVVAQDLYRKAAMEYCALHLSKADDSIPMVVLMLDFERVMRIKATMSLPYVMGLEYTSKAQATQGLFGQAVLGVNFKDPAIMKNFKSMGPSV